VERDTKIGIIFAIFSNILGGITPFLANACPATLDSYIFSGMSSLFQFLFFLPVLFIDRWRIRKRAGGFEKNNLKDSTNEKFYFGRSKWKLFIIIGITFAGVYFLYFEGLRLAGAINGILALKTTSIFGVLFGYILLKERVTKIQGIFAIILFLGMVFAITEGRFYLLEMNLGVILILICAAIWMVGHTCSRPYLNNNITTSSELLVARNVISAGVLIGSYAIIFGDNLATILIPVHAFFYILMGLIYGLMLFSWYELIKYFKVSIASVIVTPQIILTSIFGVVWLGEPFTIFHAIGIAIMIGSIVVINLQSDEKEKKEIKNC